MAGLDNNKRTGNPIIAIHGWLDNAASFIPLSEQLGVDRPFYALEIPGHGLSEHRANSTTYHLVENILDVLAFISEVTQNSDTKVTLIGHSLGGIVCALLAAAAPERVDKLVLLDSLGPMTDPAEGVLTQFRKAVASIGQFKESKKAVYPDLDLAVAVRMKGIGKVNKYAASLLVERGTESVEGGYSWTSDPRLLNPSILRFSESQIKSIFEGIECPVCLICGDQGYFKQYESLSSRVNYIQNVQTCHVSGGHHFHMDGDVIKTAELINGFI